MSPALRLALAGALLLGCGGEQPSSGDSPTAAPTTTSLPATVATGSPTPPQAPAAPPPPIGYDQIPPPVPATAENLHFKALREHKAKQWDLSKAGFEEVVRVAPGLTVARYNLACARARTGDVAGAAELLRELFFLDLPQFQGRFEKDEDLESVRTAPEGQELRGLAAALQPRWREETPRGVPAILWRGHAAKSGALVNSFYRQGVYLPTSRRFLPLGPAPRASQLLGAILDVPNEAVVLVHGESSPECLVDFCPRISWTKIERHPLWGETAKPARWEPEDDGSQLWGVHVALAGGGFLVRTELRYPAWQRVGPDSKVKVDPTATPAGPTLSLSESGTILEHRTPGYDVKGHALVLPDRSKIPINAGHWDGMQDAITISPDGTFAVVASVVSECQCDKNEGALLRHVVSYVDLVARSSALLSAGPLSAAATIAQDGTLYLQRGTQISRLHPGAAPSGGEPLPEGILLAPPDTGPSNCCGL